MNSTQERTYSLFSGPVLVGALGFFVDVYDLLLFNIVRVSSFRSLGVAPSQMAVSGESILSWQMIGLTIGGIAWGIMGDKRGRKSVLFGSILLYSVATILNGFVTTVDQYLWLRFIAGLGLAGELGASITLTSELLPKEKRGLAAALITASGVAGTVAAYFVHAWSGEDWRLCYFIGGGLGIVLLFLRVSVFDSGMYAQAKEGGAPLGDFRMMFTNRDRLMRYVRCIAIGLPVWYVIGLLISFSDEFARQFGITGFDQPKALMLMYAALALGDMGAGFLSNYLKSRKKTLLLYYSVLTLFVMLFFMLRGGGSIGSLYLLCIGLGVGSGLSVLYITMSAEQFGTNLRATAAVSIPNLVRGALPLILLLFRFLRGPTVFNDYVTAAWVTGIFFLAIGWWAAFGTRETYGQDLNFVEE